MQNVPTTGKELLWTQGYLMPIPNFFIIGAAKAGTDSLRHYLNQHPDIFIPPMETNFFGFWPELPSPMRFKDQLSRASFLHILLTSVRDISDYEQFFLSQLSEKSVGEKCPLYMYCPGVAERIKTCQPSAKIIAILRNPTDRAYSHFRFRVQSHRETIRDFADAVDAESIDNPDIWFDYRDYVRQGFYYRQLKLYFATFRRSQIRIYLYEDFAKDNLAVLRDIFSFLDVDTDFVPNLSQRYNVSGLPRSWILHNQIMHYPKAYTSIMNRNWARQIYFYRSQMSSDLRDNLSMIFRADVEKLQKLIQRDLSSWIT